MSSNPARSGPRVRRRLAPLGLVLVVATLVGVAFLSPLFAPRAEASVVAPWFGGGALTLDQVTVSVDAAGSLARTHLHFVFSNPTNTTQEALFQIPLPPHTTVTDFSLRLENETLHGVVKERASAQREYNEARERGEDAVLLRALDDTRFQIAINVPADAERALNLTYVQSVPLESGARTYRLGLSALSDLPVALPRLDLHTRLHGADANSVHYPGVALEPRPTDDGTHRATATFHDAATVDDLVVLWTESSGAWRSTLVSSALPGAPGADDAHLVASFVPEQDSAAHLPRDIVFVLDTSGSMSGDKIVQARESLREVLLTLRPDDRFGLVLFDTEVDVLTAELEPATDAKVRDARGRLAKVEAEGSTNLDGGLQAALRLLGNGNEGRVPVVVLLSDGMPTAGITSHPMIVANMENANDAGAAVHVLAIGLDADDTFLEDLAGRSGGSLVILQPDDDLQERLSGFYATLDTPILTNIRLTVEGADARDLYPATVPTLYKGSTLQLAFRANLTLPETIRVHLTAFGADGRVEKTFVFDALNITVLAEADRVWGAAHVAALLSEERVEGQSGALRDEIITASIEYGIVTRYTSWVITRPTVEEPATTSATPAAGGLAMHRAGDDNGSADVSWANDAVADEGGTDGGDAAQADGFADGEDSEDGGTPGVAPLLLVSVLFGLVAFVRRRR